MKKFMKMLTNARTLTALLILFLSAMPAPVSAQTYNWRWVNNTRSDIVEIYMVKTGSSNWGGDWLRDGRLGSGESFTLRAAVGVYDIKLVLENDAVCVWRRIAHTQQGTWTITANSLQVCRK